LAVGDAGQLAGSVVLFQVDHSGLGEEARLTPAATTAALVAAHGRLKPLLKEIPMRDGAGRIDRGHPLTVAAKTGTLYFVSALAGYITAPDGTELAFAIFTGDTEKRGAIDPSRDGR
ncbi:D-alanyl-D-alanine carboxypeptidase, partial [Roseovarius sp. SYSU LYC5161]|uniref:D-alanyl-D-alanine carboxypeptidase n=1 Tax=Roseovarius halophilus (ex Wu et al. 2025) TaxID=3376060 RepID=UPI00399A49AF